MVHAETTQRSTREADQRVGRVQARGVAQRRGEAAVWVLVEGSDRRTPHAQALEHVQRVQRLDGQGTVPGDRSRNAVGVGRQRRGRLCHRVFSSTGGGLLSESAATPAALASVGAALAPRAAASTSVFAAGCDDVAVWATAWAQGPHRVCRVQHRARLVRPAADQPPGHLARLAPRLVPLARVETALVVRTGTQPRPKVPPVTAVVAATPRVVDDQEDVRTRPDGARHTRQGWRVEVRLAGAHEAPWWRRTARPVTSAAAALELVRLSRQRWSLADTCTLGQHCLGWEEGPVRTLAAVRTLVALGWVAAGFLYELGVTREWAAVRLLARLGGGELRANRPPGKRVLTRGLRRLLDHLATEALLADEIRQHGSVPPRLAALLGHPGHE